MSESHRVALVYPYFRTRSQTELLFPPLGVANLAGQLHKLGIEVKIIDCTFKTFMQMQNDLRSYRPDIVGIYSMVTLSRHAFRIARMVQRYMPDCLLVCGGPMPTLYPERYCEEFDAIFRGEVDLSFPRFCRDYINLNPPKKQFSQLQLGLYEGLFVDHNGIKVDNPMRHYEEDELGTFPLTYRDDFDHAAYQQVWMRMGNSKTTSIITSLGCPYSCDFCSRPIFGSSFRRRNLDLVFDEIKQIRRLGYDNLWIADDTFTLDSNHLNDFCRRIAGEKMEWSCLSRVTNIDQQMTRLMKESGCCRVYLGLETGNPITLKLMKKQATLEDGANAVHLFHKAGIEVAAFFIVGYPGETVTSIEDTFNYALSLPLDEISFNVPFPLPGSELFERVKNLDKSKDWNTENEVTFVYDSEFDTRWLRRRIDQTLSAFSEGKSI